MAETSWELREKAKRYRAMSRLVTDNETVVRIQAYTDELDRRALSMEWPPEEQIRKRARELWESAGRPQGRDEEFWHRAEKEQQQNLPH